MKLYEFFSKSNDHKEQEQETKEELSRDLMGFILDDDELHKTMVLPLIKEIKAKQKSKEYNRKEFADKVMPIVNKACIKFYKEKEMVGDPNTVFPIRMRKDLASKMLEIHEDPIKQGHFDPEN